MDAAWTQLFQPCLTKPDDSAFISRAESALVVRDVVLDKGWQSSILTATCREPMTFYTSTRDRHAAFADKLHRKEAAIVKPSPAFWSWLTDNDILFEKKTWQLRGTLKLKPQEIAKLLGSALSSAIASGEVEFHSASAWAGAGNTRTPLHVDMVHALIFQIAGMKEFFLASETAIEEATANGFGGSERLPAAVLNEGNTHNYLQEGSLADIYGVEDDADSHWIFEEDDENKTVPRMHPQNEGVLENERAANRTCLRRRLRRKRPNLSSRTVRGEVVTLFPGDALLLPAGVYHDVQSTAHPALSITVRFALYPFHCSVPVALHSLKEESCCRFVPRA